MTGNINERQAQIIQYFIDKPDSVVAVKEMQIRFSITPMTARHDLSDLVSKKYLSEIAINNIKKGYIRNENFDELISVKKKQN